MGFGNNGLAKANLHGANDQKVLAGGDRESVGAGFTDSGYIVVIGPHLMSGYWGAKELTEKTFKTKFDVLRELHTGDLGWLDEEGYLFCAGRNKDIFKQGGYRVSCIEVEAAAMSANCAEAAALIPPVKDKKSKLFVLSSDKSFDFKGYLRTKIEEYKIPNKVIVLDSMPINQNGKIDKVELENY